MKMMVESRKTKGSVDGCHHILMGRPLQTPGNPFARMVGNDDN